MVKGWEKDFANYIPLAYIFFEELHRCGTNRQGFLG